MRTKSFISYEPDHSLKKGCLVIWREIGQELIGNRWLIWQLCKRDFSSMYKKTLMGIFWPFILPLISIGTFVILNREGVFSLGKIDVPYPIYVILGMAFWQLFSTGLLASSQSLASADQMLTKINFSRKSLVIASLGRVFIPFFIHIAMAAILLLAYQIKVTAAIFWIPIVLLPLFLLTLGLGFILALLESIVRDVSNILPMFLTFMMFLTPVLYAAPPEGLVMRAMKINPVSYFIVAGRDLALRGTMTEMSGFIIATIISVLLFVGSLYIFHLAETRIAERI